jgi:hypothetical protein
VCLALTDIEVPAVVASADPSGGFRSVGAYGARLSLKVRLAYGTDAVCRV